MRDGDGPGHEGETLRPRRQQLFTYGCENSVGIFAGDRKQGAGSATGLFSPLLPTLQSAYGNTKQSGKLDKNSPLFF